jgi:hypothetical protein
MSARYREHPPPPRLQPYVECFWSLESPDAVPEYPVLPDGCVDIVYSPGTGPQLVGTMSRTRKFGFDPGDLRVGVRFRPAMATGFVRAPGSETTDKLLPLSDVWGTRGRQLSARMARSGARGCVPTRHRSEGFGSYRGPQRPGSRRRSGARRRPQCAAVAAPVSRPTGPYAQTFLPRHPIPAQPSSLARQPARRLGRSGAGLRLLRPGALHQRFPRIQRLYSQRVRRASALTVFSNLSPTPPVTIAV